MPNAVAHRMELALRHQHRFAAMKDYIDALHPRVYSSHEESSQSVNDVLLYDWWALLVRCIAAEKEITVVASQIASLRYLENNRQLFWRETGKH